MPTNNLRFRNHYVPEHYLKRWAGGTSKVWTYRLLVPHNNMGLWKSHSLDTIARREHLYTRIRDTNESDELERWFSTDFESPANPVIEKVITGMSLTPNDWRALARFVALQDVRTPARMTEIVNRASNNLPALLDEVLKKAVEDIKAAKENNISLRVRDNAASIPLPIAIHTKFEPGAETGTLCLETVAGRAYWLYAIEVLLTTTVKHLEKHRWVVVRTPKGMKWLTSDNPVVKLNYYNDGTFDLGGGWGNPGSEIFLPISPEYLLYTQVGSKPRFARGERLPQTIAVKIQNFIIENSHRYIFAEEIDPSVASIRPRTVNQEAVSAENKGWTEFHSIQTQGELQLKRKN